MVGFSSAKLRLQFSNDFISRGQCFSVLLLVGLPVADCVRWISQYRKAKLHTDRIVPNFTHYKISFVRKTIVILPMPSKMMENNFWLDWIRHSFLSHLSHTPFQRGQKQPMAKTNHWQLEKSNEKTNQMECERVRKLRNGRTKNNEKKKWWIVWPENRLLFAGHNPIKVSMWKFLLARSLVCLFVCSCSMWKISANGNWIEIKKFSLRKQQRQQQTSADSRWANKDKRQLHSYMYYDDALVLNTLAHTFFLRGTNTNHMHTLRMRAGQVREKETLTDGKSGQTPYFCSFPLFIAYVNWNNYYSSEFSVVAMRIW